MIVRVVGGLLAAGAGAGVLIHWLRPVRRIWRGDATRMPKLFGQAIAVRPRTYPSAVLCVGTVTVAVAIGGVGVAFGGRPVLGSAAALLLATVVFVPLNWCVEATNRPAALVPPPYRGMPGSLAARRTRRERLRAGLPQTDHLVDILQVHADPPFLVAICTDDECGWSEFAGQAEEAHLRTETARHTTNVARQRVIITACRLRPQRRW